MTVGMLSVRQDSQAVQLVIVSCSKNISTLSLTLRIEQVVLTFVPLRLLYNMYGLLVSQEGWNFAM